MSRRQTKHNTRVEPSRIRKNARHHFNHDAFLAIHRGGHATQLFHVLVSRPALYLDAQYPHMGLWQLEHKYRAWRGPSRTCGIWWRRRWYRWHGN